MNSFVYASDPDQLPEEWEKYYDEEKGQWYVILKTFKVPDQFTCVRHRAGMGTIKQILQDK